MEAEERTNVDTANGRVTEENAVEDAEIEVTKEASTDIEDDHQETGQDSTNGLKRKRTPPPEGMSRSAFKKLKRQQEWEAAREVRKLKKKEKLREKKVQRRAAIASGEIAPSAPKALREKSTQVPVTIVIDCGFDELMTENEIKSLASQITRCYSDNSRSRYRCQLAVSGFDGRLRERFDTVLQKQYKGWKGITFYDEDFVEVAGKAKERMVDKKIGGTVEGFLGQNLGEEEAEPEKGEVIYLSSESDHTIEYLSPYSTYIIGGLVDRNRHKGICYKRACDRKIKTAKLPIGEFMEMNSRQVLATNHVNEIMLHWLEVGDWGEAFMKVIPKRKGGVLKGQKEVEEAEENDGEGGEDGEERPDDEAEGKADEIVTAASDKEANGDGI
jgi:tRNA (guanine9-N1)-methyltransferase